MQPFKKRNKLLLQQIHRIISDLCPSPPCRNVKRLQHVIFKGNSILLNWRKPIKKQSFGFTPQSSEIAASAGSTGHDGFLFPHNYISRESNTNYTLSIIPFAVDDKENTDKVEF